MNSRNIKKILVPMMVLFIFLFHVYAGVGSEQASLEKGRKIFEKAIAAMGGAEKIKKIKNISYDTDLIRITSKGEKVTIHSLAVLEYPDKCRYSIDAPRGQVIMIVNGDEGWQLFPPNPMEPMPEDGIKSQLATMQKDPLYISQNLHRYKFQLVGEKNFAGKKAIALHLTGPTEFNLFIDPNTYLPVGVSYREGILASLNIAEMEDIFFDYRVVDGIKIPFKYITNGDGKKMAEAVVKELEFNIKTGEDFFKAKKSPNGKAN
ncbi:MAG: hypothetical protein JSV88_15130 [Candidatus Aminicenantes bacterium]|nr:MAG: hypothetical protein JSV88_15130 [Candidatus Aminicenantes bacterium]